MKKRLYAMALAVMMCLTSICVPAGDWGIKAKAANPVAVGDAITKTKEVSLSDTDKSQASTYNLYVTGTSQYSYAMEVLDLVNEERAKEGLDPLEMSAGLLDAAMLRAAELSVYFEHQRPNGEMCFTASDEMYGENVAVGYEDPESVMEGWMNSEGHRANILTDGFTTIGVGVFYQNGMWQWVQCFGYYEAETCTVSGAREKTYKVESVLNLDVSKQPTNVSMKQWSTATPTFRVVNPNFTYSQPDVATDWKSGTGKVAVKAKKGAILGKRGGTETLSCNLAGTKLTVKATVSKLKPSIKVTSPKKKVAKITWKAVEGAKGYVVYRYNKKTGKYTKVAKIANAKTTVYKEKGLKSGTTYHYTIRAYKKINGETIYSAYAKITSVKTK